MDHLKTHSFLVWSNWLNAIKFSSLVMISNRDKPNSNRYWSTFWSALASNLVRLLVTIIWETMTDTIWWHRNNFEARKFLNRTLSMTWSIQTRFCMVKESLIQIIQWWSSMFHMWAIRNVQWMSTLVSWWWVVVIRLSFTTHVKIHCLHRQSFLIWQSWLNFVNESPFVCTIQVSHCESITSVTIL